MNQPASSREIMQAQDECGVLFSKDLIDFLSCSNGIQVEYILSLRLYATDEIGERNITYQVAIYAPTMLCIGDDGGGRCVLLEKDKGAVYLVAMGSMMKEDATFLAHFRESLSRIPLYPLYPTQLNCQRQARRRAKI